MREARTQPCRSPRESPRADSLQARGAARENSRPSMASPFRLRVGREDVKAIVAVVPTQHHDGAVARHRRAAAAGERPSKWVVRSIDVMKDQVRPAPAPILPGAELRLVRCESCANYALSGSPIDVGGGARDLRFPPQPFLEF